MYLFVSILEWSGIPGGVSIRIYFAKIPGNFIFVSKRIYFVSIFVAYLIFVLGRLVIHRMLMVFLVVALVMVLVVKGVNLVPIVVVLQWSLNYLLAWLVDLLVFVGRLVVHRMLVVFVVVVLVVL